MKGYTNKDFNLGMTKTLVLGGSRVALFVPRLLGKISEKLILSPITKLTTGISHEETKQAAINIVTQVQNNQAAEMQPQIDAGTKKVENWARDERGNVHDYFWYRANKAKLDSLLSKQAGLRAKPRIIMVAAAYVRLMKINGKKHTEQLKQEYEAEMIRQKYDELYASANSALEQHNALDVRKNELVEEIASIGTKKELLMREHDYFLQEMDKIRQQHPNLIGDGFFGGATPMLEEEQAQVRTM